MKRTARTQATFSLPLVLLEVTIIKMGSTQQKANKAIIMKILNPAITVSFDLKLNTPGYTTMGFYIHKGNISILSDLYAMAVAMHIAESQSLLMPQVNCVVRLSSRMLHGLVLQILLWTIGLPDRSVIAHFQLEAVGSFYIIPA